MNLILIILLILLLGGVGGYGYNAGWHPAGYGVPGILVIVLVILLLTGRL